MKETRDYILRKSFELFLQKSYKEVTMKEIVEKTGLSKGAFYHYFPSKENVFEEVVKYFYDQIMITDYTGFPTASLKDFYLAYIKKLKDSTDVEENDNSTNLYMFISEASKKVPSFAEIHDNQRQKEIDAWTKAVKTARKNGEIKSSLSDEAIAKMFIYLSDGISLTTITHNPNEKTLAELKNCWDGLYKLLIV